MELSCYCCPYVQLYILVNFLHFFLQEYFKWKHGRLTIEYKCSDYIYIAAIQFLSIVWIHFTIKKLHTYVKLILLTRILFLFLKSSTMAHWFNSSSNVTLSHPVAKCNNNQISDLPYSPESIYPQMYFNVKIVIILWVVIASYCSRFHGTHFWLMCHPIVNKKRKLVNITKGKPFIFYCSNDCIPFQLQERT